MIAPPPEGVLDEVLAALVGMRAPEIVAAEQRLRDLGDLTPNEHLLAKLKLVRSAAVHATQLWRGVLPETDVATYSRDGEVTGQLSLPELSVTA
jgi:hypothetical protein